MMEFAFKSIFKHMDTRNYNDKELQQYLEQYIKMLDKKQIPKRVNETLLNERFYSRDVIIRKQGFALLNEEWIDKLVTYFGDKKVLEVMSGCGSLAHILKTKGVDVIATDDFSWEGIASWNVEKNYWTHIENLDAITSIEKYNDRDIILMSWAYMDKTAYNCLLKMREVNKNAIMIFIGEGSGGCTANDNFYDEIDLCYENECRDINSSYQNWLGIHDRVMITR